MSIKKKFKELLPLLNSLLSNEDFSNVLELINYDEYGVAIELICIQLYENDTPITNKIKKMILDIIIEMELNLELIDGIKVI